MNGPKGLGFWIAFEGALDAGPKARDLEVAIERATSTGATWIAPRAGDGSLNDGQFDERSVRAFKDAGLFVAPWVFARPNTVASEVEAYRKLRDWGVDGFIFNAEFAYQSPSTAAQARRLVEGVRAVAPDLWIAHAPPDVEGSRAGEPWDTFDALCDHVLPQVYAWEHNDSGHVSWLDYVRKRYVASGVPLEKVSPILCSYRPKTRGFTDDGKARPTPPMAGEAERVAQDLVAGLEHEWTRASVCPSIYSLDAVSFINGPNDCVMPALRAWARTPRRRTNDPAEFQRALNAFGFDVGGVDGKVGPKTRAAFAAFCASRGVDEVTGRDQLELEYAALSNVALAPDPRGTAPADAREVIADVHTLPTNEGPCQPST